jgi:hypothetical protein
MQCNTFIMRGLQEIIPGRPCLPPFAAHSGALTRGQRPNIIFFCHVRSPHCSRSLRISRFLPFFYPPGVRHVAVIASVSRWSPHLKFDCCVFVLVASQLRR